MVYEIILYVLKSQQRKSQVFSKMYSNILWKYMPLFMYALLC